ncbi:substrate-specific activator of APC-dependent proteolysis [Apophysomyces ossiformis]|uniref:Substrate-specific activator of APC-dependent proteolysis n=1 Tax=Apophysomyces ossiformis TaxID=679940 RepID=A0A8H7BMT6_9FUNG|nr:substrate-specific activator of APC-dependent proteolysis [Apophysomyces ossiformis]
MSNSYRKKLRSAARSGENNQDHEHSLKTISMETNKIESCPKTPPASSTEGSNFVPSIESYFPPSPYGRKRQQIQGDRSIPINDGNLSRDYQFIDVSPTGSSRHPNADIEYHAEQDLEFRRREAYYRTEVLNDSLAADEFSLPTSSPRTPRKLFHYSQRVPDFSNYTEVFDSPTGPKYQSSPISEAGRKVLSAHQRPPRVISHSAIKILDAPNLKDDFYLNLIDWGANDSLAVGLDTCVYLWNANTSRVTKLCDLDSDVVTSVSWAQHGSHLAVGTNSGRIYLWDTEGSGRRIRTWSGHSSRVGAMTWNSNILTTGGRDHRIFHRDVRSPEPYFRELHRHSQEVCGLKWNSDGSMLASGGNDNNLMVWSFHDNVLMHKLTQHTAAVKAIGWNPHDRGRLVSGGGAADKTIKFWNANSGALISSHDTGSQVCNMIWSRNSNELVSCHGYASHSVSSSNQVIVWKTSTMNRVATLTGHSSRVLYMAMNPDGTTIVTGAGDETLRFWDIFSSVSCLRREAEDRQTRLR